MPKITDRLRTDAARVAELRERLDGAEGLMRQSIRDAASAAGTDSLSDIAALAGITRPTLYKILEHWAREPGGPAASG